MLFNCDLYLAEDFLRDRADGLAQCVNRVGRVEIEYRLKVLVLDIIGGVDAAAGHNGIRRADCEGVAERYTLVVIVVIVKEAVLKGIADITPVILIVARRQLMRKAEYHISGGIANHSPPVERIPSHKAAHVIRLIQSLHDGLLMLRPHFPYEGLSGVAPAVNRVGEVENIAEAGLVGGVVDQGRAAPDISVHGRVPCLHWRAGGSVRPLGVDHELFVKGVFIQPSRRIQKARPRLAAAGDLPRLPVGKLGVVLQFRGQYHSSPSSKSSAM